jgi:hypothetical protein
MESVLSSIRFAIKHGKFPAPVKAEGFSAYAIASGMGLVPEAEDAARLTLDQPMTFESLGEGLRSFRGRTLCDLIHYRDKNTESLQQGGSRTIEPEGGWVGEGEGEVGISFGIANADFVI